MTPGGGAAATNRVAMANARVEAELCSCGREQCQACNWERDWSQEVVRAAYRSLEEHHSVKHPGFVRIIPPGFEGSTLALCIGVGAM